MLSVQKWRAQCTATAAHVAADYARAVRGQLAVYCVVVTVAAAGWRGGIIVGIIRVGIVIDR